jgi:hypothetical protein
MSYAQWVLPDDEVMLASAKGPMAPYTFFAEKPFNPANTVEYLLILVVTETHIEYKRADGTHGKIHKNRIYFDTTNLVWRES